MNSLLNSFNSSSIIERAWLTANLGLSCFNSKRSNSTAVLLTLFLPLPQPTCLCSGFSYKARGRVVYTISSKGFISINYVMSLSGKRLSIAPKLGNISERDTMALLCLHQDTYLMKVVSLDNHKSNLYRQAKSH